MSPARLAAIGVAFATAAQAHAMMSFGPPGGQTAVGVSAPGWISKPEPQALTAPAVERPVAGGAVPAAPTPITSIDTEPRPATAAMLAPSDISPRPAAPRVFSRVAPPYDGYYAAAASLEASGASQPLGPSSGASILTLFVPAPGVGGVVLGAGTLASRRRR